MEICSINYNYYFGCIVVPFTCVLYLDTQGKLDLHTVCLYIECQKLRNAAPLWKQLDLEQEEHLNDATVTAVKHSAARHVE